MARQKFVHFVPRPKPRKRPGRHTKNLNKSKKRSYKKFNPQGRRQIPLNDYPIAMKEKNISVTVSGASQGQWSNLILELNIMKKAWRSYGVNINLKAPGIKNIIEWGNKTNDYTRPTRQVSKRVQQNKKSRV